MFENSAAEHKSKVPQESVCGLKFLRIQKIEAQYTKVFNACINA